MLATSKSKHSTVVQNKTKMLRKSNRHTACGSVSEPGRNGHLSADGIVYALSIALELR